MALQNDRNMSLLEKVSEHHSNSEKSSSGILEERYSEISKLDDSVKLSKSIPDPRDAVLDKKIAS